MKKAFVALIVTALTISCCSGVGVSAFKKPVDAVSGQSSASVKKSSGAIEKAGNGNATIKSVKVPSRGAVAQITHDGVGKFVVSQQPTGGKKSVLVNTTGAYNKSIKLAGGTSQFNVEADGAWSITIKAAASSGNAASSSKKSSSKASTKEETQSIPSHVWRTRTGEKYHSQPNCGTTKNATQITLQQAQSSGLSPCSKCF